MIPGKKTPSSGKSRALRLCLWALALAAFLCCGPPVRAQVGTQEEVGRNYHLAVQGMVEHELSLSLDQIKELPQVHRSSVLQAQGATVDYQGVLLNRLLELSGIKPGADLVVFFALDGHSAALPLEYVMENRLLVAHSMNGMPLSPDDGFPLKAVPDDLMGYKWVEMGWLKRVLVTKTEE